jgi:hypothetical protein
MSTAAAAAVIGAALLGAAPANAQGFSIGIAPGGVGFSYDSGGYCDDYGCPDDFWDYPLYYCPVYFRGQWYDGPVYYRQDGDEYWYWIHGNWRRDQWNGLRPQWACFDRYGPPLGLDFYVTHGFRVRDDWRRQWEHGHDRNHGLWNGQTHRYDWQGHGGNDWSNQWLGQHGTDHGNWNGSVRGWKGGGDNGGNNQGGSQNNQIKLLGTPGKPPGWSGGYNGSHDHGTVHLYNNGFVGGNGGNPGNGNQGSGNTGGNPGNGNSGGTGHSGTPGWHLNGGSTGGNNASGSTGGNTGGSTGGSTSGNSGGNKGGSTGGGTGGSTGGNSGGSTGGSTGGNNWTGGNSGGSSGGNGQWSNGNNNNNNDDSGHHHTPN